MARRRWSLQFQLPLLSIGLLLIVAAAVTAVAHIEVKKQARAAAAARLTVVADRLVDAMQGSVPRALAVLERSADDSDLAGALAADASVARERARASLADMIGRQDSNTVIALWDLARRPVAVAWTTEDTTGWMEPPPLVDSAVVLPIRMTADSVVFYDLVTPVHVGERLAGFLQRRTRVVASPQLAATVAALLGDEGRLLYGSRGGTWTSAGAVATMPPEALPDSTDAVSYRRDSALRLGVGRAIPGTPWLLVAELPERAALAGTSGFLGRVGLLALALALLAAVPMWLLGRGITRPLQAMAAATDAIRRGELEARAPEAGHPEMATLAEHFNQMADENARHIQTVEAMEQRLRSLITATAQIVWWTDPEGNVRDPIPAWLAYTGQSFEESRGTGWTAAVHPEDAGRAVRVLNEAIEHRSMYETEYRLRRHDGEYRWFLARAVPVLGRDGKLVEWVGTYTDTTRRRDAEDRLHAKEEELRQSQRLESIGRLAGGVAHDFNNMLTAILVPAELMLARKDIDTQTREDVLGIHEAATRATDLTRQLLAFGRQQLLTTSVLELDRAIEDGTRLLKRVLPESVVLDLSLKSAGATVCVDRTQLDQVLLNLAVNARDAMRDGGRLTIETASVVLSQEYCDRHDGIAPGRYVQLAVTDTGHGMDQATLSQVFEPFFTTKAAGEGTGLGLSTVYGIVRQSGGHVWIYSEPGKGTSVKVHFPQSTAAVPSDSAETEGETPTGTGTILFAEDDATLRRLGHRLLAMLGYTVLVANNGEEAIAISRGHEGAIDLLVTDVVMPGMNGMELWEALRRERAALPALFLSGWASDAVVRHRILEGDVPFLQKPFTLDSLGRKVHETLTTARR